MSDPIVESHNAEAQHQAAVLMEAQQKATHASLVSALREVLNDEGGSPLLIKRIPFICTDIAEIKKGQDRMVSDFWWLKWIGGIGIAFGTTIALPVFAWVILQIIDNSTQIAVLIHK